MSEVNNREEARKGAVTALLANVSCIVGLLSGGILFALLGGGASVSAGTATTSTGRSRLDTEPAPANAPMLKARP